MPEIGKLSTWLIENGGTLATWIIVSAIVLFTVSVKKDEWFGKRTTTTRKPTEKPAEPEPKKAPEPETAKAVKAEQLQTPKKEVKKDTKAEDEALLGLLWFVTKVVAVIFAFIWFFPGLWWVFTKPWLWVDVAIVVLMHYMVKYDKPKKRSNALQNTIWWIFVLGNAWLLWDNYAPCDLWSKNCTGVTVEAPKSAPKPSKVMQKVAGWDIKTDFLARKILFAGLPVDQASQMYFVLGVESGGYNQFDVDGKVITNSQSGAKCVAQIMENPWWPIAEKLGYNLDTAEGCLNMAVWIRKNDPRGIHNWDESLPSTRGTKAHKYTAPADSWSEPIRVHNNCYLASNNTAITIKDDKGRIHQLVPGEYPSLETDFIWIRSDEEDDATLVLLCR